MLSLRAADLGKAYRLYQRPIDSLKEMLLRREYAETLWALRHVSFELAIGGSLGIIGDNGAGKSTLLRVLAGAVPPSEGRIERHGRTSAMLSLGAGFHPDLSGRENIQIGCAMLGLSPAETKALTPAIIDFSELGEFIERPVRTYSSGMQLRLGFSVATAVEPDILIVDEHLSVGDQHFRHKCMKRIQQLRERGCALVFCSHDLYAVREVCEQTMWLHEGAPALLMPTPNAIDAYMEHVQRTNASVQSADPAASPVSQGSDNHLTDITLGGDIADGVVATGARLELRICARLTPEAVERGAHVGILIERSDRVWCYATASRWGQEPRGLAAGADGNATITFRVPHLPLLSGKYSFTVTLMDDGSPLVYDTRAGVAPFAVRNDLKDVGVARVDHAWVP